ncbi:MAG: hypothetical protein JSS83_26615 [Cyanobacteria bacterium SZAS LIN-3]|nr:hypothetical protein [Cyanobacteria bacterium SZAS LIN-3]
MLFSLWIKRRNWLNVFEKAREHEFARTPKLWSILFVCIFPFLWTYAYLAALTSVTAVCNVFGIFLPSSIPVWLLLMPYFWVPIFAFLTMCIISRWFLKLSLPILFVCCAAIGLMFQSRANMENAFWMALGQPVMTSLEDSQKRASGFYYPNRCQRLLNKRASAVLEFLGEKVVCNQGYPDFLFRLLVLRAEKPTCIRAELSNFKEGGILVVKKLDSEPNTGYVENSTRIPMTNKFFMCSTADIKQCVHILEDARTYCEKNQFKSSGPMGTENWLLEIQLDRTYYFFCWSERFDDRTPPPFLSALKAFSEHVEKRGH